MLSKMRILPSVLLSLLLVMVGCKEKEKLPEGAILLNFRKCGWGASDRTKCYSSGIWLYNTDSYRIDYPEDWDNQEHGMSISLYPYDSTVWGKIATYSSVEITLDKAPREYLTVRIISGDQPDIEVLDGRLGRSEFKRGKKGQVTARFYFEKFILNSDGYGGEELSLTSEQLSEVIKDGESFGLRSTSPVFDDSLVIRRVMFLP